MKPNRKLASIGILTLALVQPGELPLASNSTSGDDDPAGGAMMQQAQRIVAAYHAGQPPSRAMLRVVYFVPSDVTPLSGHADRLDRVMTDVSDFYRDGLRRFGLKSAGLPLERKNGKLVLHLVRGKSPASAYHHDSGNRTAAEIRQALKSTVDLEREHVLVFYALCRQEPDGRYIFDAPYYGGGSQRNGLCHAADCELLDPRRLTETTKKIVYTEHYYPRVNETVALFNTKYLGGVAHELGHALGLPHDAGSSGEERFGVSLMGGGNLAYRRDKWGGGKPAYLARASALLLLANPLITGSDYGRKDKVTQSIAALRFSTIASNLVIQGTVAGAVPPYAVIAYLWPVRNKTDHAARTFPVVLKDGALTLVLDELRPDTYHLKLASLHLNGATVTHEFQFGTDAGAPDVAGLNGAWQVNCAERAVMQRDTAAQQFLSETAIAAAPTPATSRKLRLLRSVITPADAINPATAPGGSLWLSAAQWTDAKVGWGQPARNYFWFDRENQNGVFLMLGGQFHDKGLYAHSPAQYTFNVAKQWKTFTALCGLRDGAQAQGSAIFTVLGDGRELFRSRMLHVGERERVTVGIGPVTGLELRTEGGEGHNHNSWAIWAEPKLER